MRGKVCKTLVIQSVVENKSLGWVDEEEIRVPNHLINLFLGSQSENHLKPWKNRVVSISSPKGTIYRIIIGTNSLSGENCWIGQRSLWQLGIDNINTIDVKSITPDFYGRFLYYTNHLKNDLRITFFISFWGAIFGILSLMIGLVSIRDVIALIFKAF